MGFWIGLAFVLGALFGSFLNVVIARVPFGQSIVWPPSHCMACGTAIEPFHNIPILSWFILRGRCKTCGSPFSIRYALIELAFALVCAFAVARHGLTLPAAREMVMMFFLIPLAAIDLQWWILPHSLTRTGAVAGLLLALPLGRQTALEHLLAAAIGFTALMLVGFIGERVLKREALGGGDPWLMALIGAFLGLRALLPVILLASIQGTFIGLAMIAARRKAKAGQPGTPAQPDATEVPAPAPQTAAPSDVTEGARVEPQRPVEGSPAAQSTPTTPPETGAPGEEPEWTPDPTAVPFGPFLALAAAEVLYFTRLPGILFPF